MRTCSNSLILSCVLIDQMIPFDRDALYDGHISKRGDKRVRALLYEAAIVVLTGVRAESAARADGAG